MDEFEPLPPEVGPEPAPEKPDEPFPEPVVRGCLFLCGPYTGHEDDAWDRFRFAGESLGDAGYLVVNPMELCLDMDHSDWDACMRVTVGALVTCAGVALLDGWRGSRGCRVEEHLARSIHIPCMSVENWVQHAADSHSPVHCNRQ